MSIEEFSFGVKQRFADKSLVPGAVIRTYVKDTHPPKTKIFVVIGRDEHNIVFGSVYINSKINLNVFSDPAMKALHKPLFCVDYPFLVHDSYVDCSRIYPKPFQDLVIQAAADLDIIVGELSPADLESVRKTLTNAFTISSLYKEKFGLVRG